MVEKGRNREKTNHDYLLVNMAIIVLECTTKIQKRTRSSDEEIKRREVLQF